MPLKLLGKKSWNVYNAKNIARVRHDEAEARAREAADDIRQQAYESARHSAFLRGEETPTPPSPLRSPTREQCMFGGQRQAATTASTSQQQLRLPKRKRNGENDTDFEMRVARVRMEAVANERGRASPNEDGRRRHHHRQEGGGGNGAKDQRPLIGHDGHIDLFGLGAAAAAATATETAPAKGTAKVTSTATAGDDDFSSVVGMRFVDAVGKKHGFGTWYAGDKKEEEEKSVAGLKKRVPWAGPWPRQHSQAAAAVSSNRPALLPRDDPLAAMKQGAATARAVKRDRQLEAEQRQREIEAQPEDEDEEKWSVGREEEKGEDGSRRQRRLRDHRHYDHSRSHRHHDHSDHKDEPRHRSDRSVHHHHRHSHHHHRHKYDGRRRDSPDDSKMTDKSC